jgi:hypothetical protein
MTSSNAMPREEITAKSQEESSAHVVQEQGVARNEVKQQKSLSAAHRRARPAPAEQPPEAAESLAATSEEHEGEDHIQRAELLLEQSGQKVGEFASTTSQRLRRWSALAKEEVEDMWAEAKHIRDRWWNRSRTSR